MNSSIDIMSDAIAVKMCITCSRELPIDDFGIRRSRSSKPDGHWIYSRFGECRECANKRKALWRSQNPDYMKNWYSKHKQNGKQ